jgi:hypothetical protein
MPFIILVCALLLIMVNLVDNKLKNIEKELISIKTVLIIKNIMPVDLANEEKK